MYNMTRNNQVLLCALSISSLSFSSDPSTHFRINSALVSPCLASVSTEHAVSLPLQEVAIAKMSSDEAIFKIRRLSKGKAESMLQGQIEVYQEDNSVGARYIQEQGGKFSREMHIRDAIVVAKEKCNNTDEKKRLKTQLKKQSATLESMQRGAEVGIKNLLQGQERARFVEQYYYGLYKIRDAQAILLLAQKEEAEQREQALIKKNQALEAFIDKLKADDKS